VRNHNNSHAGTADKGPKHVDTIAYTFSFLFGAVVGSFLNVVIYRVPLRRSIISPASACPACKAPIRWYDNIPILSYLLLKAKCRYCNTHISLRYPIIEGISGVLNIIVYWKYPQIETFAIFSFFWGCMLVVTMIDWDEFIIPDLRRKNFTLITD